MSYIRKLTGQTAIYGLSSVVPRLLNYILVPLHTRVFLQEEYGIITEMYAYLAFLLVILTYGMETGFFRFASKEENTSTTYSTAFYSLLTTSSLFFAAVFLFSNSIVNVIGYPQNPEYVVYLGAIIAIDAFCTIPFAKLRLENRAKTFSLIKIISVVINVGLNFFFLALCPKYEVLQNLYIYNPNIGIGYVFISNLVSSIFVLIILLGFNHNLLPTRFSVVKFRVLLLYSFPLLVSGLGGTANEWLDRIFLKYLIPPEQNPLYQLGIYGANLKLAVLMVLFIQMFRYAAEPFFFSTANTGESKKIYADVLKYFLVFTILIFLGVSLFTDIFKYFVGEKFREGLSVVPILLLANLFNGIYFNLSIWFKLSNRTWFGIYYTFAGAAVTISLYFLLIPSIGFYGAAIARLACYIFMTVLCYYGSRKYFNVPYQVGRMILYLISGILIFIIGYFVKINNEAISFLFRILLIASFLYLFVVIEKIKLIPLLNSLKNDRKHS